MNRCQRVNQSCHLSRVASQHFNAYTDDTFVVFFRQDVGDGLGT